MANLGSASCWRRGLALVFVVVVVVVVAMVADKDDAMEAPVDQNISTRPYKYRTVSQQGGGSFLVHVHSDPLPGNSPIEREMNCERVANARPEWKRTFIQKKKRVIPWMMRLLVLVVPILERSWSCVRVWGVGCW